MIIKRLKSLFRPNAEQQKFIDSMIKLCEEYDIHIGPRGGISKTSKPEFVEKHKQELNNAFPEIREAIKKNGYWNGDF